MQVIGCEDHHGYHKLYLAVR